MREGNASLSTSAVGAGGGLCRKAARALAGVYAALPYIACHANLKLGHYPDSNSELLSAFFVLFVVFVFVLFAVSVLAVFRARPFGFGFRRAQFLVEPRARHVPVARHCVGVNLQDFGDLLVRQPPE